MPVAPGTRLSHYEIRSQIGAGGMGEVYLAQDIRLRRSIALKILPLEFTENGDRLRRFEQEASTASGLNHPNIITIHEIGSEGKTHFIATEFIDGESLRQHVSRADIKVREVLDIVIQVASALTAAHEAGIVHRDIKPENIMVRRDGYVKVLDFGLAKLMERQTTDSEASTMVNTDPGVVMGTASYMSPEQARGIDVDARTDIWSLGVVIYEMMAGRVPFEGTTTGDMLGLILGERNAPLLARFARDVPSELERIVTKALTKERDERYQTAKDLLNDLKRLKQQLDVEAEMERTAAPEFTAGATRTSGRSASVQTMGQPAPASTSNAQYIAGEIKRHKLGVGILGVMLLGVAAIAAVAYFGYFARDSGPGREAITSIAVLPFVNASNNPDAEYLSDGISESLINSLSQLPQLKVIARSSSFKFKGKTTEPGEVAKALGVRAIVTGRVIQVGEQLQISAELVDTSDGTQVWGEQYNRKATDLLAIQSEISREISEKLRLKLTGEEQMRLTKRYTENTQAYQLYIQGRYYWNKRTPESLSKAIEYFNQAINVDPKYALAYAGLADCYVLLTDYGVMAPKESAQKTKTAAMTALEIDDTLAEARTSLAFVKERYEWDFTGAEKEFKRAIELNPNYATAHQWYGESLSSMGRHQEAIAENKRAQELDPLALIINVALGARFYLARQYDEAVRQLLKTLELDPNFPRVHFRLGLTYVQKGMYREAVAELQKTVELSGRDSIYVASLAYVYGMSGQKAEALKLLDELKQRSNREYVSPYYMAFAYVGLGEKDQAFAWLERACQERDFWLRLLKVDPVWDSLRSDPRFADILRRIGFA